MFPSGGYFQTATCPFYIHGLCHRPYCHFKHIRSRRGNNDQNKEDLTESQVDTPVYIPSKITSSDQTSKTIAKIPSPEPEIPDQFFDDDIEDDGISTETMLEATPSVPKKTIASIDKSVGSKKRSLESSKQDHVPIIDVDKLLDIPMNSTSLDLTSISKPKKKTLQPPAPVVEDKPIPIKVEKPKKKVLPLKLADVDFFGVMSPPKKIVKTVSKLKNKVGRIPSTNMPPTKICKLDSELESDSETGYEDSDDESALKAIFNDFTVPEQVEPVPSTLVSKTTTLQTKRPDPVVETVGVGSLKKRVAHGEYHEGKRKCPIVQKKKSGLPSMPSFVSPSLTNGSTKPSSPLTSSSNKKPAPVVSAGFSYTTEQGEYVGKQRTAHVIPPQKKSSRPKIQVEYGAKVPQLVRQRYLDKFIDELLLKSYPDEEAFAKALEEEAVVYQRCTRKQIYMNLSVNVIKRFRGLSTYSANTNDADPMVTARPTVTSATLREQHLMKNPKVIRPVNHSLAGSKVNHSSVRSSNTVVARRRRSTEIPTLTEELFYNKILTYLATEQELWDNGYPRASDLIHGEAKIKPKSTVQVSRTKPNCLRCGKQFLLTEDDEYVTLEECHFHWGKLRRVRGRGDTSMQYQCCSGEPGVSGCCSSELHIPDRPPSSEGFVTTFDQSGSANKVYSLDCEMCYTIKGLELTRVTVVNFEMKQVYDTFVVPPNDIIDYNTRFSGVTEESLRGVKTTLQNVQAVLLNMFPSNVILMGHSLESDLKALKLIHSKVVDTALVFPHRLGLPYKRALRNLMADHLKKIIQEHEGGHDSFEDSAACMELMRWKIKEDLQREARNPAKN